MFSQNTGREIKAGDKVKVNLQTVAENGVFDSDEQEKQFEYLQMHPDEVFTVAGITNEVQAHYQLEHPIVGATSFYAEELILEDGINDGCKKCR